METVLVSESGGRIRLALARVDVLTQMQRRFIYACVKSKICTTDFDKNLGSNESSEVFGNN